MNFNLGEFFCGPGGIALGSTMVTDVYSTENEPFTITPTWATDYDIDTCRTYSMNIHNTPFLDPNHIFHSDIRELDIPNLPPCDGFAFGFPCNDFSNIGESKGLHGNFGPLYSYGISYLEQHQPQWFIAENVGGLSSANEGKAFKLITTKMVDAGYKVVIHLYKFEDYGLPQARHRIIIVGIRNELNIKYRVPAPTHINKHVSSSQAINNPPISQHAPNNERTRQSPTVIERLQFIKPGDNAWSLDIPEHLRLNVKGAQLSNIYKRLDPQKPAYTVTGSGGGGTYMYHWDEPRALTNRERARLQTFPDDFVFAGGRGSVRKQIGMAVPPVGMAVIFRALLKCYANIDYDAIPANK